MRYFNKLLIVLTSFMVICLLGMMLVNTVYVHGSKVLLIIGCVGGILTLVLMLLSVIFTMVRDYFKLRKGS